MTELKPCPVCGSKAFLSRDVIDGVFFMGWSAGCPRYCIGDGIHGIETYEEDETMGYSFFGCTTKEEAIEAWNRRAEDGKAD